MGAQISRLVHPRRHEAAHKVFDITELLDMIMLNLGGYHNILVARAVCKRWQAVFEQSLAIKRITFRAPGDHT
ncbi:hypothetical protein EJ03DRAFT_353945 [Teratosphaeria nubilosa]|uniref:F-box domain-containing protein n=1 Tax=Teratosphaeria nubilosa TaxID=161662 RepID=A0A6G1L1P1_9PEZI|nr:hypothetical protein EJ03DRAFT_353945 [Teratosphaeria nubilosa]